MVPTNSTSGQKEICSSADRPVPLLICVISARSDLYMLTQEKKSLPTNCDKSDGRTPTGRISREGKRKRDQGGFTAFCLKVAWTVGAAYKNEVITVHYLLTC